MIKVYNAKTQKKEELSNKDISLYVCGPTVYNDPHIGNIRPIITFDVLYNLMLAQNYHVHYVHNITDIDDKIIARALQTNTSEQSITQKYTKDYLVLMETLNLTIPEIHKVSEEIPDILAYIQTLIDHKFAYVVNGSVYFDVNKVKNYGEVSHNKISDLISNVRIENETEKKNPLDFALWKKTSEGMNWDSPWSKGRPGWHTECSLMINKYLGKEITIHGGGVDLKFPHHENENAQNYGINNCSLAHIFQYVGHLTINGQKMSKSLGNVIIAKDLLKKYGANEIRWFFYQKYYGAPIDYSEELMQDVCNQLNKLFNALNVFKTNYYFNFHVLPDNSLLNDQAFLDILNDDLNFADAISLITSYRKNLSSKINAQNKDELVIVYRHILFALNILGIVFSDLHNQNVLDKINLWQEALKTKDFQKADEIRSSLISLKVL